MMQLDPYQINPSRRDVPQHPETPPRETELERKRSESFGRDRDRRDIVRFDQRRRENEMVRHERVIPEDEPREVRNFFPDEDRCRGFGDGEWGRFQ